MPMRHGTLEQMSGSGHISLSNGVAYGEPYESAVADVTVQGKDIEAGQRRVEGARHADRRQWRI